MHKRKTDTSANRRGQRQLIDSFALSAKSGRRASQRSIHNSRRAETIGACVAIKVRPQYGSNRHHPSVVHATIVALTMPTAQKDELLLAELKLGEQAHLIHWRLQLREDVRRNENGRFPTVPRAALHLFVCSRRQRNEIGQESLRNDGPTRMHMSRHLHQQPFCQPWTTASRKEDRRRRQGM